jgi:hypothetical protein
VIDTDDGKFSPWEVIYEFNLTLTYYFVYVFCFNYYKMPWVNNLLNNTLNLFVIFSKLNNTLNFFYLILICNIILDFGLIIYFHYLVMGFLGYKKKNIWLIFSFVKINLILFIQKYYKYKDLNWHYKCNKGFY